jgi:ABC-type nitrate/sulfonate/bicarbonate transport system ATPase subunit
MAVILIAFLWFGQERTPVFTAFLIVFPVMAANTSAGVRAVDLKLVELARVYGLSRPQRLGALYLPAIAPFIVGGLRSALSLCWKVVVAAEVLVQPLRALGTGMQRAKAQLETAELFAWTAAAVLAAALAQGLLTLALFLVPLCRRAAGGNSRGGKGSRGNGPGAKAFPGTGELPGGSQAGPALPALSIENLAFSYGSARIFDALSLELGRENPVVFLGPSGCGKTTLLFLIARLLEPSAGRLLVGAGGRGLGDKPGSPRPLPPAVLVFQEPRLLPWLSALENVALPLQRLMGKGPARERARYFLELAGLGGRAASLPAELSGGQRQRVSLARAFAFPSPVILLDEPFQSQDIPLKLQLMDLVMALLDREEGRLAVAVTHDPREAVYLGRRIIVLGRPDRPDTGPAVPVFDEVLNLGPEERSYGSPAQAAMERRLLDALVSR